MKLHGVPPYSTVPTLTSSGEFKREINFYQNLIGMPCVWMSVSAVFKEQPLFVYEHSDIILHFLWT